MTYTVTCEKKVDDFVTAYARVRVSEEKAHIGQVLDEGRVIEVYSCPSSPIRQ